MTKPLDARSLKSLEHVHPDLVGVVRAAYACSRIPFIVIQGLRTVAEEQANVAKGASTTMHSRHLADAHGLACAVDVMADPDGRADWKPIDYQPIAAAMLDCGHQLGVTVEWGGDWKSFKDWGHFQLPWRTYP